MSITVLLPSHSQHQSSVSYVIPPSFTTSFLRQLRRHSSVSYDVILPQVTTSFLVHLRHHLHVSFVIYNVIPPPISLAFLRWLWYHSSVSYRVIPPSVPLSWLSSLGQLPIHPSRQLPIHPYFSSVVITLSCITSFLSSKWNHSSLIKSFLLRIASAPKRILRLCMLLLVKKGQFYKRNKGHCSGTFCWEVAHSQTRPDTRLP